MEELIFHWGLEGFGARIYRITKYGKVRFLKRYSSMDMDENDDEVWRHGEVEYKSFEDYWKPLYLRNIGFITTPFIFTLIINPLFVSI